MAWICRRSAISGPKRQIGERVIERASTWFNIGQAQTTHLDCNISRRQILAITGLFRLSGLLALAQPYRPKVSSAELSDSFEVLLGRGWPVVVSGRLGFAGHGAWTGSWWLMNDDMMMRVQAWKVRTGLRAEAGTHAKGAPTATNTSWNL